VQAPLPQNPGGAGERWHRAPRCLFERLAGAGRVTQISAPSASGETLLLKEINS
jgi:hypothetical protein